MYKHLRSAYSMGVMIVQDDAIVRQGLKVWGDNIGVVPAHVIETCSNTGCLQSPATWLFVQQFNQEDHKKNQQTPRLCGKPSITALLPSYKGRKHRKLFDVMTTSTYRVYYGPNLD